MAHKKFMNRLLSTSMHVICCLRARDKVKMVDVVKDGKKSTEVVPIGIQPIAEKSFVFEQLLSLQLEEKTHLAIPIKVPEPLVKFFAGDKVLTKADGERIRQWNETGSVADAMDQIRKRARMEAEDGTKAYAAFYSSLTAPQKKALLDTTHAENKRVAEAADKAVPTFGSRETPVEWPDGFDGPVCIFNGDRYEYDEASGGYKKIEVSPAAEQAA